MTAVDLASRQKQVLLMFLGVSTTPVDPIRIMKGMFLITKKMPEEWLPQADRYEFIAYDYGPCSFEIYRDLDDLVKQGLVRANDVPGESWKRFSVSPSGKAILAKIDQTMSREAWNYISRVRQFVGRLSFQQLLKSVYAAFPDYARNSVFQS
jgi:uncharacterized protein YwgA